MLPYAPEEQTILAAVRRVCETRGIAYRTFSDGWIVRMEKAARRHYLYGYGDLGMNTHAAAQIALDKVAAYLLLDDAGVPAVPHWLLSTVAAPEIDRPFVSRLLAEHGPLVIKPLKGGMGRQVHRVENLAAVLAATADQGETEWAASPFTDIAREVRLVVFDDTVPFAHEKNNPVMLDGLKMFNLSLGAGSRQLESAALPDDLRQLGIRALAAVGLRLAAVDVAIDTKGVMRVLEINCNFSLEHFARRSPENRSRVIALYADILATVFS